MVSRIIYTNTAKKDLQEIYRYISYDSKFYAKLQILKIKQAVQILKTFPNIGREVPDFQISYIREIIEGNFRIIYMVVDLTRIDILTIHHTSKELKILDFL
jgi:toxin ParE1/3/4